ncbi:Trypsin-like peptidase domain-containing protein [Oceanobacillus limi]|uniref:Trypsin-like peptidase domain-containing protein n=1 Tax=Oceanobacillus limi TaxID=930131 RepID=A0A1I0DA23_9BACI|nr:S1C family serine protease [Oceanobacillus limi]SET28522.1 Trypsin-like peptidase domain-containing protein [Oceanobacillus limi]
MRQKRYPPIILTIIIGILGITISTFMYLNWNEQDITINNPIVSKVKVEAQPANLKNIIHQTEKNVVQIEAQNEYSTLTGSGFVYNEKGDIITNAHVIQDAEIIYVRTANARIYPAAVIGVGTDTDIAVVRVPQLAGESGLPVDEENTTEIGDEVIALGSPHGFQNTVTLGIISGTERNFSVDGFNYQNAYQISAQITQGNSGGPLVNRATGKVIGINSVGTDDGTIGFSIPISDVLSQVETWSNEAQNDQLQFTSTEDMINSLDPDQFKEDASYLIEYFLDSIFIRDYVSAYSLLGDDLQSSTSYSNFRDGYIQIIDLEYENIKTDSPEDNKITATADVAIKQKLPDEDEDEEVTENKTFEFTIGYENDQLKIIKLQTNE